MADTYEVMGVTYSTATGLPISGVTNESTTKVEEVTKKEVVEAVPPDETNDNTDGSTAEENQKVNLTVIANNETTQIGSDQTGTFIVDKNQGHGLHVQKNGDVIVIAGSPG